MNKYNNYKEIPQEVKNDVEAFALKHYNMEEDELESLREDFVDFVREGSDYIKDIDSCYITYTYNLTTDNYKFEVVGQCYLKDQCICDEQMNHVIYVYDLKEERLEKSKLFLSKTQKNFDDWNNFLKDKTLEEVANELMKYEFPKKL